MYSQSKFTTIWISSKSFFPATWKNGDVSQGKEC